jgi:acid phosphatase type 7
MLRKPVITTHLILLLCSFARNANALADKFRIIWQDDPSASAVIAWNQASGDNPVLYLDVNDFGTKTSEYGLKKRPDHIQLAKGMANHFVRLQGLIPNMTYYFIIKDSEGLSQRMFFTTAPNKPDQRLSIIAGGDSRNHQEARRDANLLVSKLRPHCVMFGGDFTERDTPEQWQEWLDDWQLTISRDGRVTPIIVTRGNHEESNQTLTDLFDLNKPDAYYAINLGGNLVRIYTLNTLIPVGGEQRDWLEEDLRANGHVTWKLVQYHHPMRPHTQRKAEKNDQVTYWAPLFHKYNVNLVVECDAHVVKSTFPIRPDNGPGSDQGFIRDDAAGTVYVGEGCWGAPLRENNDDKSWTRASGSFNQFNWIFIDREKIEVRTIQTDGAERVGEVRRENIFLSPIGLSVWSPPSGGVITIAQRGAGIPAFNDEVLAARSGFQKESPTKIAAHETHAAEENELDNWDDCPIVVPAASGDVALKYSVDDNCDVVIRIVNAKHQEVSRLEIPNQNPGEYLKTLKTNHLKPGKYLAIVKGDHKVLRRYRVIKR